MKVNLDNAESVVEVLRLYREKDDVSRWAAGDVALAYLSRFEYGKRMAELEWLAAHSGYTRNGLRERVECSAFWEKGSRRWNNSVTWSHYNRARRGFDFEDACDLLEKSEAETWSVAQFELYCQEVKAKRRNGDSDDSLPDDINPITGKKMIVELPVWMLCDDTLREYLEKHGNQAAILILPGTVDDYSGTVKVML